MSGVPSPKSQEIQSNASHGTILKKSSEIQLTLVVLVNKTNEMAKICGNTPIKTEDNEHFIVGRSHFRR